jgi:hypothetical protein
MTKMTIPAKPETLVCRTAMNQAMIRQIGAPGHTVAIVRLDLEDIPRIVAWLQAVANEICAREQARAERGETPDGR